MKDIIFSAPVAVDLTMDDAVHFIQEDPESFVHFVGSYRREVIRDYLMAQSEALVDFIRSGGLAMDE